MPSVALIGPPGSGKSTVFELLGGTASRQPLKQSLSADRAVVNISDPRFERLAALFSPKKRTPATLEIMDLPGFEPQTDSKLKTGAFAEMRRSDCLAIVLDLFTPGRTMSPDLALRTMWEELTFADYAVVQKGVESVEKIARAKHNPDAERRHTFLLSLIPALESGTGLRRLMLDEESEKQVRQYGLLTRRPILAVVNLAEESLAHAGQLPEISALRDLCSEHGWPLFLLSAKVEHEISELDAADRAEVLASYHLDEPGLHRFIRAAHASLDLITFFTVGEDEVHGWTVRRNTPARRAAGAIHSDLERGFIRGEVIASSVLVDCGSLVEAKKRGLLRLEGKDYPVQDGDILHVRFSV